jgi:hypothetical protein
MVLVLILSLAFGGTAFAAPQASDSQPVRVWLEAARPVVPGAPVHAYVQTSVPGDLIVLHRRTDGGVDVLFPTNPQGDPFTQPGTYEIVTADQDAAFAAGAVGQGMVLAALAAGPMRFGEFEASDNEWDGPAFAAPSAGGDPEATFTDAVQRMLGDGAFNYDLATYDVVPPEYAYQDTTQAVPDSEQSVGPCAGCVDGDWATWLVVPSLGCVALGCGFWGERDLRHHGCEEEGCAGAPHALAAFRSGRPNGAYVAAGGRPPLGSSSPRHPLSSARSVAPATGGWALRRLAPTAQSASVGQLSRLQELPPVVIVQPSSRAARVASVETPENESGLVRAPSVWSPDILARSRPTVPIGPALSLAAPARRVPTEGVAVTPRRAPSTVRAASRSIETASARTSSAAKR